MQTDVWEDDGVDLRTVVARIVARRWWVLGSVVFFTVLFAAYAFLARPVYTSSTILTPARAEGGIGIASMLGGQAAGLASLAGISVGDNDTLTQEALAVLRSRRFIESFIADRELMPVIFAGKWDSASKSWTVPPDEQPTPAKAYEYFVERVLAIGQDKKTGLVTVSVTWGNPDVAAEWANELVRRLNEEMRGRAISHAAASVEFLEKERATSPFTETRDAINRLIEGQVKQRMLASVTREYAFRVVDAAMPSDLDRPSRPNKFLLLVLGPVVGLFAGIVVVLLHGAVVAPSEAVRRGQ